MEGGRRESHTAHCWTQIIWSFENQSSVHSFCVCLFLSRVNKLCWQPPAGMYLAQAMYTTNFKGQPWPMKNTICNTVLCNALGICVCKCECKNIPSLEGLQSPLQAALCVRGVEGNQPGDRHGGCNALTWSEVGKSCFSHHHKNQCSREVLWKLCCAQAAARTCVCAWLLL